MNKSQRIKFNTTADNYYTRVRLEQNIDTLEFLNMNIDMTDVYQNFNADYGVLVGRVIANGGVGVPNAKISIFIPLADEDVDNDNISNIYPYRTPKDVNSEGKRYNLLPRVGKTDPITGILAPKQPFGSFPIKEEILTNVNHLNVYKKYYKYTALTNKSGDYMIFGVPIGTQTVHMSVDITDIGEYSMTPAAMVTNLGYSPNLFTENNIKIKPSTDLNDLPHIETQEISVDIIPFWGDINNFEIGITQQNFRIRSVLTNTFVIFGSAFTDGENSTWGNDFPLYNDESLGELYRIRNEGNLNLSISSKRIGIVTEKIYYYPSEVTDAEIENLSSDGVIDKMKLLNKTEYSTYKRDGDYVFIISCNRKKIIKDDLNNEVEVDYNSNIGVFTEFRGFITLEINEDDVSLPSEGSIGSKMKLESTRMRFKFPQYAERDQSFELTENNRTTDWRKQHYLFKYNKFYSFSKFNGTVFNKNEVTILNNNGFFDGDVINSLVYSNSDPYWNTGIIKASDIDSIQNDIYKFPANNLTNGTFGANWLNLCVYFPQFGKVKNEYSKIKFVRCSSNFRRQLVSSNDNTNNNFYFVDNEQPIVAGDVNTKWFARSDLHWTDFIEVPVEDILTMRMGDKGFTNEDVQITPEYYHAGNRKPVNWVSGYTPLNGGKINGDPSSPNPDNKIYFYRGLGKADCIQYLFDLGLVT